MFLLPPLQSVGDRIVHDEVRDKTAKLILSENGLGGGKIKSMT